MKFAHFGLSVVAILGFGIVGACDKGSSTVTGTSGAKLTIVQPADQTITQGETNKVGLAIVRQNFDNAVEIEIDGLPSGVSVAGGTKLTIPTGTVKFDSMTLVADKDAAVVRDHRVSVTAKGPDGTKVTEFFKLTVKSKN